MQFSFAALTAVCGLALHVGATLTAAQTYTIREIPTLRTDGTGISGAEGISPNGTVIGFASVDGSSAYHAYSLAPNGTLFDLGFFGSSSFNSLATAINASGQITGSATTQSGGFGTAFRGTAGVSIGANLDELPSGGDSVAYAINSAGVIVGWSNRSIGCGGPFCINNPGFAVVWTGNSPSQLPALGTAGALATGINDAGIVCGNSSVGANPDQHAFRTLLGAGIADDLGTLGGPRSTASAINDAGTIVGSADMPSGMEIAAIWPAGSSTALSLGTIPGRPASVANALNNNGVAVGSARLANTASPRAVLFPVGAPAIDLNGLIPADSGWILETALDVNDSGQIVGRGTRAGQARGFVLTLVPTCSVDFDGNGLADPDDVADFITAYFSEAPPAACDFNGDGLIDPDDLADFITEFFNMPC